MLQELCREGLARISKPIPHILINSLAKLAIVIKCSDMQAICIML